MRIKVCGITNIDDALYAYQKGAHALGFIFYEKSPRCIQIKEAKEIASVLPPFVTKIAVVVNPTIEKIKEIEEQFKPQFIQFHGDEDESFCSQFDTPYIKAIRVATSEDMCGINQRYPSAKALLFDTKTDSSYGGTGKTFDWTIIPPNLKQHWILSGGLNSQNIREAIKMSGTSMIDLSSSLEESPGKKSKKKMDELFEVLSIFNEIPKFDNSLI